MIHSDLAGKNRIAEDVFTSNCLGLLGLLGDVDIVDFLGSAKSIQHELLRVMIDRDAKVTLEFWRYLPGGGIPDVIIDIGGRERFTVIVEVKHGAPKSGTGDNDQLARYWGAAKALYGERCAVIYLTHHRVFPKEDVEQSIRQAGCEAKIFWLNWHDLFRWTDKQLLPGSMRAPVEKRILRQLQDYLSAYGYRVFLQWDALISGSAGSAYSRLYATKPRILPLHVYRRSYRAATSRATIQQYMRIYSLRAPSALPLQYRALPME